MSELIGMIGTLSALLTLVGTYRLAGFFFGGGAGIAVLLSLAVTSIYLVFFEQIILLLGVATLVAPIVGLAYWYGGVPTGVLSGALGSTNNSGNPGSSSGNSGGGSTQPGQCGNCGVQNDPDDMFCDDCGYRLKP